jgi:hypothetical protein
MTPRSNKINVSWQGGSLKTVTLKTERQTYENGNERAVVTLSEERVRSYSIRAVHYTTSGKGLCGWGFTKSKEHIHLLSYDTGSHIKSEHVVGVRKQDAGEYLGGPR